MLSLPRAIYFLFVAVALVGSVMPMNVLVGGIIGQLLAPQTWMATLPVTTAVIGIVLGTFPSARLMASFGRKRGFMITISAGIAGLLFAAFALSIESFYLFCLGTLLASVAVAAAQQMRFAAVEYASAQQATNAIAFTMLAGVLSAIIGPELGAMTSGASGALSACSFVKPYLALAACLAFAILWVGLTLPEHVSQDTDESSDATAGASASSRIFWIAVTISVTAFGVMSYIMTATPISMHHHYGFSLDQAKSVVQSHIVAMFLPSLITGHLITRWGYRHSITIGWLIFLLSCLIAFSGQALAYFFVSLVVLGLGWNILFTIGTAVLAQGGANHKQQAQHDFLVFSAQAMSTVLVGSTLLNFGWQGVILCSTLALLPCFVVIVIIYTRRNYVPL